MKTKKKITGWAIVINDELAGLRFGDAMIYETKRRAITNRNRFILPGFEQIIKVRKVTITFEE